MGSIKGLMSSLLLRKSATGTSPEQRQQIPSGGKDFLRGGKNTFQVLGASILTDPQLYTYRGKKQVVTVNELLGLADHIWS